MVDFPKDKKIILFDGVCNLCDNSVQFIIKRDHKDVFRFVALQTELGNEIIQHIGITKDKIDSIILYEPGIAYYTKAHAVLKIAYELNTWYRFLPKTLLSGKFGNIIYDFIAQNRYKWFGKKNECMIVTKELKAKFLTS